MRGCGSRAATLRATPRDEGDPVTELLPGEDFAVLEYAGGWAWGYRLGDHVVGYVEAIALADPIAPTHIVCEAHAPVTPDSQVNAPLIASLPMAALLHGAECGPCLVTEYGCVSLAHLRPIAEQDTDPVIVAERLLGAPWRDGGRSEHGIDAGGLIQIALGLCGVDAPRFVDLLGEAGRGRRRTRPACRPGSRRRRRRADDRRSDDDPRQPRRRQGNGGAHLPVQGEAAPPPSLGGGLHFGGERITLQPDRKEGKMSDMTGGRPPAWFWIVAVLALLWEGFGVAQYLMHVGALPNNMEMSAAERSLMNSSPMWVTGLFAVGVFGGALGALGLLLRQSWARLLLILSLVAVVLQFGGWLLATDAIAGIGPTVFIMPAIIVAVAILLVWVANLAAARGWLR